MNEPEWMNFSKTTSSGSFTEATEFINFHFVSVQREEAKLQSKYTTLPTVAGGNSEHTGLF